MPRLEEGCRVVCASSWHSLHTRDMLFDIRRDFCAEDERLGEVDEGGRAGYTSILVVWVLCKTGFGLDEGRSVLAVSSRVRLRR